MNFQPRILVSQACHSVECNCACADEEDQAEPPLPYDAHLCWSHHPNVVCEPLTAGFAVYASPAGRGAVAVLNGAAQQVLAAFPARPASPLSHAATPSAEFLAAADALAQAGLITPWPAPPRPAATHGKLLTAWLHLTHACNLRCTYCFVPHSAQRMTEATGKRAIDAVLRTACEGAYRAVKLKYAGGEPTLHFNLVRALHRYARQAAAQTDLALRELLLSNGVHLDDAMIAYLHDEAIDLMISLDGIGAAHDGQRPTAAGAPTAVAVTRTIDRCLARDVRPDLSVTVTAQNAYGLAEVVAFALERGLHFNLNFVRSSGSHTPAAQRAEDAALIAGVQAALQVIQAQLPPYRLIDGLLDRSSFHAAHEYACGAGRNYLAIGPDGQIARCHTELHAPVAAVDDPQLLTAIRMAATPGAFHVAPSATRASCAACQWRPWCGGGCPVVTRNATGAWLGQSPYCFVYRALYPEVLRTEGLRLLKYATPGARHGAPA